MISRFAYLGVFAPVTVISIMEFVNKKLVVVGGSKA